MWRRGGLGERWSGRAVTAARLKAAAACISAAAARARGWGGGAAGPRRCRGGGGEVRETEKVWGEWIGDRSSEDDGGRQPAAW